jgi:hypothetical protein
MIRVVNSENGSLWFIEEKTEMHQMGRSHNIRKTIHKVFLRKEDADNRLKEMRRAGLKGWTK